MNEYEKSDAQELSLFGKALTLGFYVLVIVGELYWIWMSFKLQSLLMFVVAVIPLTMPISSLVGAYGLFFGLPDWVYGLFA